MRGCESMRRCWQTLAQQKVAASVYEMRNLAKSKSIQALVGMLQCCQLFALHCSFPHSPSPIRLPPVALVFPTFSTVSQFSHTKKVQRKTKNANLDAEPETGSRKYSIQSENKQPTISHHLLPGLQRQPRLRPRLRLRLQLQQRNEKFPFYLN